MTQIFLILFLILSTSLIASPAPADEMKPETKPDPIQAIIDAHHQSYAQMENFSAIQVSVKAAGELKTYVTGTQKLKKDSKKISPDDLFEIGSITKSFTAAMAVMAESEEQLNLDYPLDHYLKNYPHWGGVRLTQLLDMSSGIPNYSDAPKLNYLMSQNLKQFWNQVELIDLVYSKDFNPPRKMGYFYSNTGYVLMDMILSSQNKLPFRDLLKKKIIDPLKLSHTFYPLPNFPTEVLAKMVHGYSYNVYDNPELLGQDVTEGNLSWAGAAGGIVSNSQDVVQWVEHLFIDELLLNANQKMKMQALISLKTGKPITQTNASDPRGFGLGLVQAYDEKMGRYWFYEGETLGYRALYIYVPCNQVIIVALLNSATNGENDHAGELMKALYTSVLTQNKQLGCKSIAAKKSIRHKST